MVPEDTQPKFQLEMQSTGKSNDRDLLPLNQFINTDQSSLQRMQVAQQNYLGKLNQLSQKLFQVDRLS